MWLKLSGTLEPNKKYAVLTMDEYDALKKKNEKLIKACNNLWTLVDLDITLDVVQEFRYALKEIEEYI